MKTIIAGSRSITDLSVIRRAVGDSGFKITEIVSGCAHGVDATAEALAPELHCTIRRFPADWGKFGKRAGYLRNTEMAQHADALIAIWDGKSPGTKHMLDIAAKHGLAVFLQIVP